MTVILILALIVVLILWLKGKKRLLKTISDLTSSLETSENNYKNLQNEVMLSRATWLLEKIDDLF